MVNELDKTDQVILKLLEQDARLTHKEIAHRIHKSVTPVHIRIKRLIGEGFIKRYTVILDHKKVGRGLIAYTQVQMKHHSQDCLVDFMNAVVKLPEVMECYHMTGAYDFLLRIAIKDMDEYNQVLMKKLSNLPAISNIQSLFVMSEAKNDTACLLNQTVNKE